MLVLKLPLAILGCSDCDIVNFYFLFVTPEKRQSPDFIGLKRREACRLPGAG